MTTRTTAREELLAALRPCGFLAGRIDLPTIWPALSAWMLEPATDVDPDGDDRYIYLSEAPDDDEGGFAGEPPAPLAGSHLLCLEIGRHFSVRERRITHTAGTVGVALWYAAEEGWDARWRTFGRWIDMGPMTPHIDAHGTGSHARGLFDWFATSRTFATASRETTLAAEVFDSDLTEALLVLPAP